MATIRAQSTTQFTKISNAFLQIGYNKISPEAHGFLCCLLSFPPNWIFHKKFFYGKFAGRTKIDRIFYELQNKGYLEIKIIRSKNGRIKSKEWIIREGVHE